MRIAVVGVLAVVVLAAVVALVPSVGFAERSAALPTVAGGGLITVPSPAGEHRQQLTLVDPETRTLAVYHIDTLSGEVTLKSVRNFYYDLKMSEFNGTNPLPRDVRSMLDLK